MSAAEQNTAGAALPSMADLRRMAAEVGLDDALVNQLVPLGKKPTNEAKRELVQLIADRLGHPEDIHRAVANVMENHLRVAAAHENLATGLRDEAERIEALAAAELAAVMMSGEPEASPTAPLPWTKSRVAAKDGTLKEIQTHATRPDVPSADQLRRWSSYLGLPFPAKDFGMRPKTTEKETAWTAIKEKVAMLSSGDAANPNTPTGGDAGADLKPCLRAVTPPDCSARSTSVPADRAPGAEPMSDTVPTVEAQTLPPATGAVKGEVPVAGVPETRRTGDLQPNSINGTIFSASLTDEGIGGLVADIAARGIRQAIEIRHDGTIVDGERRWRAAMALGLQRVPIVVRDVPEEEIPGYVLDAYATTRDATVRERVGLYRLALHVLRDRHGKRSGRPSAEKPAQIWAGFLEPKEIKAEAARRAKFSSATLAEYADRIFRDGGDDLKAQVNSGELAITAAYAQLPKITNGKATNPEESAGVGEAKDARLVGASSPAAGDGGTTEGVESVGTGGDNGDPEPEGRSVEPDEDAAPVEAKDDRAESNSGASKPTSESVDLRVGVPGSASNAPQAAESPATESTSATSQGDGGGKAPGATSDRRAEVNAAWQIVASAVSNAKEARKLIAELARRADLEVWVSTGDREDDLGRLGSLVCDRLRATAKNNHGQAVSLLAGLIDELREVVESHAPVVEDE